MTDRTTESNKDLLLITGASSDIGRALIRHLLSRPVPPTVIAHSFHSGSKLAELQAEFGDRLHLVQADLSQSAAVAVEISANANPLGRNAKPEDLLAAIDLLRCMQFSVLG
jgi:NADP-dependent 3-hydroxy acid dehydrogenase YdfG